MSRIAEHLAELTAHRDRDALDAALAAALHDLLGADETGVYRLVGAPGDRRWQTRARLRGRQTQPESDPCWADPARLPALDAHPLRRACVEHREGVVADGSPALTLLPLDDRDEDAVVELRTAEPLDVEPLRLAAAVLRIYRNCLALLDYGERDTLTGLLNRKTFEDAFVRVQARAPLPPGATALGRGGHTVWLGVVDIDHFKAVNDCHGHLIGDEVLLLLSRLMREVFRGGDQLYRFGGEEFVVLLRSDDAAGAGAAFERLRQAVEHHAFPRVGRVTVSIGYTAVRPADVPTAAFERADQACYHAKQSGRNRVESHASLIARGTLAEQAGGGEVVLF